MNTERKGLLTKEQEKQLDDVIKLEGFLELVDLTLIKSIDNILIARFTEKMDDATLTLLHLGVDEIFKIITQISNSTKSPK